jgi:hypothetical protein
MSGQNDIRFFNQTIPSQTQSTLGRRISGATAGLIVSGVTQLLIEHVSAPYWKLGLNLSLSLIGSLLSNTTDEREMFSYAAYVFAFSQGVLCAPEIINTLANSFNLTPICQPLIY